MQTSESYVDSREPLTSAFSFEERQTNERISGRSRYRLSESQYAFPLTIVNSIVLIALFVAVLILVVRSNQATSQSINRIANGHITIAGVPVYSTGSGDSVIVLLPDVFGSKQTTWNVSDLYAAAGFTVIDLLYAIPPWDPKIIPNVNDWKKLHPFEPILARITQVIVAMNQRGYTSIQAQGYCYGGRASLLLGQTNLIRSVVAAHPSDLIDSDALLISKPVFLVVPQFDDPVFLKQVPFWNTTLRERQMEFAIKVYPNATHGFGTWADDGSINAIQKLVAVADSIEWFLTHQ